MRFCWSTIFVLFFELADNGVEGFRAYSQSAEDQAAMAAFTEKVRNGPYMKIGPILGEIYETFSAKEDWETITDVLEQAGLASSTRTMDDDKLLVEVIGTTEEQGVVKNTLETLEGFVMMSCMKHVCSGYMPVTDFLEFNDMEVVNFVRASMATTNVGLAENEASQSMFADDARTTFGVDGNGLTIGVLSDSYNALGGENTDILSGDLPNDVNVLQDLAGESDEGRAMLQLIHDVAPGANLAFHTAFGGQPNFAQGILDLADPAQGNCDVIVDDITDFTEPFFQDGVITQAVDAVAAQGVVYFSAAGNRGRNSWEGGPFNPTLNNDGETVHDFDGTGTTRQLISPGGVGIPGAGFSFQWDEPFASVNPLVGSTSNIDINVYDPPGSATPVFVSSTNNINQDAIEFFRRDIPPGGFEIEIVFVAGDDPPGFMKWIVGTGNALTIDFDSNSGTSLGHAIAALGAGVGAANFAQTPGFGTTPAVQEDFTSAGGLQILFDTDGNRLPVPETRMQPRVVGPDGTSTTVPGFISFFGTSAAAPNVAAVALLMLEASGDSLTPAQVFSILEQTAQDMDDINTGGFDTGFDFGTGFGFVLADDAVSTSAACALDNDVNPVIGTCPDPIVTDTDSGQCTAVVDFTVPTATDDCPFGVTVGASPASGAAFDVGETTVTVTATDVAGNMDTCSFDITVNDNEDPTVTCPDDIEISIKDSKKGVDFPSPQVADNCGVASLAFDATSGDTFPRGTTTVTVTATDENGNTATCTFDIKVESQLACFSPYNTVEVEGKGLILMDSLEIGDLVQIGKDEFSRVFSFIHLDHDAEADFLQVHAEGLKAPLEITPDHMIYVNKEVFPVRASQVKAGDMLGNNKVTGVKYVKRAGVYAPVTESGNIVVSGVLASSYAAVRPYTPVNEHLEAHAFFAARRMICAFNFDICSGETHNDDGIPTWLSGAADFAKRTQHNAIAQVLAAMVGFPLIAVAFVLEQMIRYSFAVGAIALGVVAYKKKYKTSLKVKVE